MSKFMELLNGKLGLEEGKIKDAIIATGKFIAAPYKYERHKARIVKNLRKASDEAWEASRKGAGAALDKAQTKVAAITKGGNALSNAHGKTARLSSNIQNVVGAGAVSGGIYAATRKKKNKKQLKEEIQLRGSNMSKFMELLNGKLGIEQIEETMDILSENEIIEFLESTELSECAKSFMYHVMHKDSSFDEIFHESVDETQEEIIEFMESVDSLEDEKIKYVLKSIFNVVKEEKTIKEDTMFSTEKFMREMGGVYSHEGPEAGAGEKNQTKAVTGLFKNHEAGHMDKTIKSKDTETHGVMSQAAGQELHPTGSMVKDKLDPSGGGDQENVDSDNDETGGTYGSKKKDVAAPGLFK